MEVGTLVRFTNREDMYRNLIDQGFDENSIFRIVEVKTTWGAGYGDIEGTPRNVFLETLDHKRVHRDPLSPPASVLITRLVPLSTSVADQGV